jgi:hypothetical protein
LHFVSTRNARSRRWAGVLSLFICDQVSVVEHDFRDLPGLSQNGRAGIP